LPNIEEPLRFEDMFDESDITAVVGDAEVALRKQMGDENFERMMHYQRVTADNDLALTEAHINRVNAIANIWQTAEQIAKVAAALAVAWSIHSWTFGRIFK
jgi:hypothetical protein